MEIVPGPDGSMRPGPDASVGDSRAVLALKLRRDRFFQLGVLLVAVVLVAAAFAPWLAPGSPVTGDLKHAYLQIGRAHV